MKKLLLVIVVISVVFFAGCNKTENGSNNDTKEIFFDKVENESGDKVETFEKSGNKVLTSGERLEMLKADNIEVQDSDKIEFLKLTPYSEKVLKVNDKNITLKLDIIDYKISDMLLDFNIRITSYNERQESMCDYYFKCNGSLGNGSGFSEAYLENSAKEELNNFFVDVGLIKDMKSTDMYFIFKIYSDDGAANNEEFYLYTLDGKELLHCFNYTIYGNPITKDDYKKTDITNFELDLENYSYVDAIDYCNDMILVYDIYTDFEIDPENIKYQESVKIDDINFGKDNVRHRMTIENGKIVDEIIKIYENIPEGFIT